MSTAYFDFRGRDSRLLHRKQQSRERAGGTMNNLDRFMEYLVAGVFLCVGIAKIWSYQRRPKPLGAQRAGFPIALPYGLVIAAGLFEVVAALALLTPYSFLPHVMVAPLAIAGLALLTGVGAVYHMRRHETAVPNVILFLLVMFVAVARWV
jgi:VIT1/CCC1 family predicted Fe2+/Mn2+ transporter